jgi:hypothetical protein
MIHGLKGIVGLMGSCGTLSMVNPLKSFPNEGRNIRVPLLPLYAFLPNPGRSPAGNNVIRRHPVQHITGGIHPALITGTKPIRVFPSFEGLKNILYLADNEIFNNIV